MKTITFFTGCFLLIAMNSLSANAQEERCFKNSQTDKDYIERQDDRIPDKFLPPHFRHHERFSRKQNSEIEQQKDLLKDSHERMKPHKKWKSPPDARLRNGQGRAGIPSEFDRFFDPQVADSVVEAWVSHYASGLALSDDWAYVSAIDDYGNVYVTGNSDSTWTGYDYLTIKYDSSGVKQWVSRYNGPGNFYDVATAIAVDASGNVYVTGQSYGSGTECDYATIKYNSSGVEQWVSRYNGPGNDWDEATAIAVDALGNVYVTGRSYGSGTEHDYATIKYDSNGEEQWVSRYNGPGNSDDEARDIAADSSGNVYVTGRSDSSGTWIYSDFATIKYNSSGVEQWVRRYNGPRQLSDDATAIAVDASGNVYVTGWSDGSGTSYDYATIKYNSSGEEQWVSRYNGPGNSQDGAFAIAVDASGNVYVTGRSFGSGALISSDYATTKYDSSGVEQWVSRYNGPGNSFDHADAIAVDASGNVYVTGTSEGSGTDYDYATIKYNSNGVEQWVSRYNGPGNDWDFAFAIAVDASGNVYVTGSSYGSETSADYATIKYNSNGVEQWVSRYNGPGNFDDRAYAIAADSSGNVYVTGHSYDSGTDYDYATIKYNSSGVEQWVSRYNGPGNSDDWATAIAADSSGNVYVTGWSVGSGTDYDYATIKYNSSGVEQWVSRYNGPDNSYDYAYAIAVDASGNVYVTGLSVGSATSTDYATIKYNSNGVEQSVSRYNGPGNSYDGAYTIAADSSGNVYVTGHSYDSETYDDYATIKYNSSGVEQWVSRYNGPGNGWDEATAIALDASNNVYVTGYSYGSETSNDYATIKYNSSGEEQWVSRYNGPGNSTDEATAITLDASGNVYVTGYSSIGNGRIYTTIKYVQIPTAVEEMEDIVPKSFELEQNYPNPFNPSTKISWQSPVGSWQTLKIYDVLGNLVATLVDEYKPAGSYEVEFNVAYESLRAICSGVYFYKLRSGNFIQTKKMIFLK